jgi:hypothetical protein
LPVKPLTCGSFSYQTPPKDRKVSNVSTCPSEKSSEIPLPPKSSKKQSTVKESKRLTMPTKKK